MNAGSHRKRPENPFFWAGLVGLVTLAYWVSDFEPKTLALGVLTILFVKIFS